MLLTVDIGNTNITVGVFASGKPSGKPSGKNDDKDNGDGEPLIHWRLTTARDKTPDEYAVILKQLLAGAECKESPYDGEISAAAVSCVVPTLVEPFTEAISSSFDVDPLFVGPGVRTGMAVATDDPREVGADRISNAVAARAIYGAPVIVVDFGTAITFDFVNDKGEYAGGAIAPGIRVASEALFKSASRLSRVELTKPAAAVGTSTSESLRSGIIFGYAAMIDGMVGRIKAETKAKQARVVATGGLAPLVVSEAKSVTDTDEFLILKGLKIIHGENNR